MATDILHVEYCKIKKEASKNNNRTRTDCMKDVVLEETIFIDEKTYQQIKKNMCKKDDYFTEKEFKKIDVILT